MMFGMTVQALSNEIENIVASLVLSLQSTDSEGSSQALQMIEALRQNIQIMLRLESDTKSHKSHDMSSEDITQIGDYALNLLDEISIHCANRGMQEEMLSLHRLSLPVASWLKEYGGQVKKLDIMVNAIASYANTLQDSQKLAALASLIADIAEITDSEIKRDLEATNPMRPWRILNLNWGIVATRTHNPEIMQRVFDQLIKNIPDDVQQFFKEGMQQMDIVGYPQEVRIVMEKYAKGTGEGSVIH